MGEVTGLRGVDPLVRARQVLADARDLLGGNGILLDFRAVRQMADVEAVHTFEAPKPSRPSSSGRDITGLRLRQMHPSRPSKWRLVDPGMKSS